MRGETGGGRWKVKREEGENEGKRKAGGTREAKGGIWNKNQATLVQSFVVFIPDPIHPVDGVGGAERKMRLPL